ncbi:hypothetical protein ANASTE_00864 [Anaerofustis stercorihominis DSM 17244]|uniref:Uncharacterized protein n=1 Tax=Anaerofustis stercorihominis DSM 17244 TaxID=445971 RepID=B1C807_9FIRM|nr:hypothetical protein ANASTE_00864 [Anaerofustis stercorihominis DSM 17244]
MRCLKALIKGILNVLSHSHVYYLIKAINFNKRYNFCIKG